MVPRIVRRRRRTGLIVSGSLLVAGLYYLNSNGPETAPSPANQAPVAPVSAPVSAPLKKSPAPAPDPFQKPVLNLELPPMAYGTNARPPLKDLPAIVADLPPELLPSPAPRETSSPFSWRGSKPGARRLVIVGDVHGQLPALQELLAKVGFDRDEGDHLILTGDLVNKGPNSAGVVQLAMDLGASAVRGNHDDALLLVHKAMKKPDAVSLGKGKTEHSRIHTHEGGGGGGLLSSWLGLGDKKDTFTVTELQDESGGGAAAKWDGKKAEAKLEHPAQEKAAKKARQVPRNPSRGDEGFRALAATMTEDQLAWLAALPVILRIGHISGPPGRPVPSSAAPWNAELVVVHAGLVPSVPLAAQDPWAVTHMRSLKYPAEMARRAEVKRYLAKVLKQRNRGRAMGVTEREVDLELERLHKELPAGTWRDDRDVAVPAEKGDGDSWSDVWNEFQNNAVAKEEDRVTVIYGHDAKGGLRVDTEVQVEDKRPETADESKRREETEKADKGWFSWLSRQQPEAAKRTRPGTRYAFGLDSGCVYGKQLSALILEAGLEGEQGIVHKIIQVNCEKAVEAADKKGKGGKGGR